MAQYRDPDMEPVARPNQAALVRKLGGGDIIPALALNGQPPPAMGTREGGYSSPSSAVSRLASAAPGAQGAGNAFRAATGGLGGAAGAAAGALGGLFGGGGGGAAWKQGLVQNALGAGSPGATTGKTEKAAAGFAPETPIDDPTATGTTAGGLGAFANKLEGFDSGKLNSGHDSPKYQFGRVLSQFDPKGGITQEMLDALNSLGLGTVTGKIGGDKISIGGNVDPRFEGVTDFDIIRDLENGGGWQWSGVDGGGGGGGGAAAGPARGGLNPLLAGDPLAGIQAAIGQYAGPSANLQALLQQLGA